MKTLIIDNFDSFVYNIAQLLRRYTDDIEVVENNNLEGCTERYDRVIISPGPGNPDNPSDSGDIFRFLRNRKYGNVLGVCFGHQALGSFLGSRISHAPVLMHGEIDSIHHFGGPLFNGVPETFMSVRYHSLVVSAGSGIVVDAVSGTDGSVMAFHSPDRRYFGVQFHPESFYSQFGDVIIRNFMTGDAR